MATALQVLLGAGLSQPEANMCAASVWATPQEMEPNSGQTQTMVRGMQRLMGVPETCVIDALTARGLKMRLGTDWSNLSFMQILAGLQGGRASLGEYFEPTGLTIQQRPYKGEYRGQNEYEGFGQDDGPPLRTGRTQMLRWGRRDLGGILDTVESALQSAVSPFIPGVTDSSGSGLQTQPGFPIPKSASTPKPVAKSSGGGGGAAAVLPPASGDDSGLMLIAGLGAAYLLFGKKGKKRRR